MELQAPSGSGNTVKRTHQDPMFQKDLEKLEEPTKKATTSTAMQFNASRFYGRRPKENVTLVPASGNLSDIGSSDDSLSDDDNDPDYIPPVVGTTSVLNTVTSIPDDSDSCSEETDDVSARLTPCSSAKKGKPSLFQWKEEHLDNFTKMPDDFEEPDALASPLTYLKNFFMKTSSG
ncbi:uncharacterized protein LOC120846249 [Ixodes scapularis]|uniref:uncharacterized protein LOC120846249 n=1 Tax=Ixodes scapularis TaxID=6945 RepID=UPI001A9F09F4|nr:uncharacterized protein LOC120846249 [Ixodes scapularis]